ncbi:MAG: peptidase domain-containing ABC transporter, partial [Hydrococcus sp. SU_1_0]|nr:peptidase domain-containing ABC transporter [Hydrococcus sp. SU_1_0]
YGRNLKINRIRELVGTQQGGTTMLGLKQGAEVLGFTAKAIKASPEILDELHEFTLPAIIYWKGYHYIVLYGKKGNKYVVSDPALGIRYLTRQELIKGWQGFMMLLLEPDPERFFAQIDDEAEVNSFDSLLKRLWQHRGILKKLLPLNLVIGLLALATPLLLQFLTDRILIQNNINQLTIVALGVILLSLANAGFTWIQSNLVASLAEDLQKGLKLEFGNQVLHLPLSYHEARRSGTAIYRLADIQQINLLVSRLVIELPIKTFIGLVAAGFIFVYSWKLGLVAIAIGAVMTISTFAFQPVIKQATHRSFSVAGENAGVLSEAFNGALTLKTLAAANQLQPEIQRRLDKESKFNFRTAQVRIINNTFSEMVAGIGTVILLWFGSILVFQGELTIGKLIAIYGLKEGFLEFIVTLVKLVTDWTQIKAITRLLAELFEYNPENRGDESKSWVQISDKAEISLQAIDFHYPGRIKLLENLSVTIPGGQIVALIGKSGCGKSTCKLLAGLYPLQSGKIYFGNHQLQDLPLDCLRQQVSLVPQDTFFLHRSIIDNFRLGAPDATLAEIIQACQITGADEFIAQFPQQYDTVLGVVGANISGGQKQRIAIARAILNNPPLLILDESTANLDPKSEKEILDRLLHYRQNKTTILISHRPQVIDRADWIVMLDRGRLQFNGSYNDFRDCEKTFGDRHNQNLAFLVR